jgi:hypothetical protein
LTKKLQLKTKTFLKITNCNSKIKLNIMKITDWEKKFFEIENKFNLFQQSNSERAAKIEEKLESLCARFEGFETLSRENRRRIVELEIRKSPSGQTQQVNIDFC